MSVAFAQQTEGSRIAGQKEEAAQAETGNQHGIHVETGKQLGKEEVESPLRTSTDKGSEQQLKTLCKELTEESGEISSLGEQPHSNSKPGLVLGQASKGSLVSEDLFALVRGLPVEETLVSVNPPAKHHVLAFPVDLQLISRRKLQRKLYFSISISPSLSNQ